jgi:hypothetical protein
MTENDKLTRLCQSLGASPAQAAVMAAQLLKRAEQISAQRGISREAALQELLEIVVKGRAGEVPARFEAPKKSSEAGASESGG